ncbi:uncharacterized protein MKZ38_000609 [Zalerion maritima]|uniref:Uncharacterized protein n=1 Tax=Zalerion maritima TaxID=339359 RepID=A0AAD5RRC8_9PEZI|nr:uncharacterized protein MKZ38_000609 [Zalerion maritima]
MDGNWPLNSSGTQTAAGAVSEVPGSGFGPAKGPITAATVTPRAAAPSGPSSRGRGTSASTASASSGTARRRATSTSASHPLQEQQQPHQRPSTGFSAYHEDHLQPGDRPGSGSRYPLSRTQSSPHILNDISRHPEIQRMRIARMAAEERERESVRELAKFFRSQSPPNSNIMARAEEFDSTSSSGSSIKGGQGRAPHQFFPLLHPGKWGRLKSIKRKKRRTSGQAGRKRLQLTQIKLPDSAVAGTTIGGHRHIAISIPLEYCHLGPTSRSQYPVYANAGFHSSLDRQSTKSIGTVKSSRTAPGDRAVFAVLKPVAEDRESVSSSATRSQIHRFDSLDGTDTTPLRPPPQQETYRPAPVTDGGSVGPPMATGHARARSLPLLNEGVDFVSHDNSTRVAATTTAEPEEDALIHRPEVWIPKTRPGNFQRHSTQSESLASKVYIPRSGDRQPKEQDELATVYVPTRNSSFKRKSGSIAEALAILSGTWTAHAPESQNQNQYQQAQDGSRPGSGNQTTPRMSMQSIAASIASKLSESEPNVGTARVARLRPATILLDAPNAATSMTSPPATPLLVDFPSPPGTQDMFVNIEPTNQPYNISTIPQPPPPRIEEPPAESRQKDGEREAKIDASAGEATDSSRRRDRRAKVRERKQRDIEILRAQKRNEAGGGDATSTNPNTPRAHSQPPPESPVLKQVGVASPWRGPRRTKSDLSLTPLMVIADVTPISPPRTKKSSPQLGRKRSVAGTTTSSGPTPPESPPPLPSGERLRLVRPSASLPLDRTSLSRRREWREMQTQGHRDICHKSDPSGHNTTNSNSVSTSTSTFISQQQRQQYSPETQSIRELRPKTSGGPLRPHRRGRFSELADSHGSITTLSRSELLFRYESLRDRHMKDTERRLRRLEKNGDVWLKSIAPLLENLNKTLSGLEARRSSGGGRSAAAGGESGDNIGSESSDDELTGGVRKSVKEWRQRRRDIYHSRRESGESRLRARTSHGIMSTATGTTDTTGVGGSIHHHPQLQQQPQQFVEEPALFDHSPHILSVASHTSMRPTSSRSRVVSAEVDAIERKSSIDPSSKRSRSNTATPTPARATSGGSVVAPGNASQRQPSLAASRETEDGNVSNTSGMETLEPLMRELQGAARLSLESNGESNTPLVEESAVFSDS